VSTAELAPLGQAAGRLVLLRRLTAEGTAWPFVVVATVVLAALLLGWRALAHVVRSRAEPR